MKNYYTDNCNRLSFASPSVKLLAIGALLGIAFLISLLLEYAYKKIALVTGILNIKSNILQGIIAMQPILFVAICLTILLAVVLHYRLPAKNKIKGMVERGLFYYPFGNPLHLKEGERLPKVKVIEQEEGKYDVKIKAGVCNTEELAKIASNISSIINSKGYDQYAVIGIDTDIAMNWVKFLIEDVTIHKEIVADSVDDLLSGKRTKLLVQKNTYIDLTTSGSILCAGKTRSGKTTAIISLLLQVLSYKRDAYNSQVIIIDPKQAELSRLPHTVTLDEAGGGTKILEAMQSFENMIKKRQKVLNTLSEETGDAVHWWDAQMNPSFLFIDEYVSLRTVFPAKASKENPEYSLANFDALLRRIVTMGASAGAYVIISIAEASVESAGFPAMLRSAMSTKILAKPTAVEGRLLWDSEKLKNFPDRVYNAGEAWFSSTDGIHDNVTYVHFPVMQFKVYAELARLLDEYYSE